MQRRLRSLFKSTKDVRRFFGSQLMLDLFEARHFSVGDSATQQRKAAWRFNQLIFNSVMNPRTRRSRTPLVLSVLMRNLPHHIAVGAEGDNNLARFANRKLWSSELAEFERRGGTEPEAVAFARQMISRITAANAAFKKAAEERTGQSKYLREHAARLMKAFDSRASGVVACLNELIIKRMGLP